MAYSRKRCRDCLIRATPKVFITANGLCAKCSIARAVAITVASIESASQVAKFNPRKGKWESAGDSLGDRVRLMMDHTTRMHEVGKHN